MKWIRIGKGWFVVIGVEIENKVWMINNINNNVENI